MHSSNTVEEIIRAMYRIDSLNDVKKARYMKFVLNKGEYQGESNLQKQNTNFYYNANVHNNLLLSENPCRE